MVPTDSRVHLTLVSLSEWPLVPLLFFSNINKSLCEALLLTFPETSLKPLSNPVCFFFLNEENDLRLQKSHVKYDLLKFGFSNMVVNTWSSLYTELGCF